MPEKKRDYLDYEPRPSEGWLQVISQVYLIQSYKSVFSKRDGKNVWKKEKEKMWLWWVSREKNETI